MTKVVYVYILYHIIHMYMYIQYKICINRCSVYAKNIEEIWRVKTYEKKCTAFNLFDPSGLMWPSKIWVQWMYLVSESQFFVKKNIQTQEESIWLSISCDIQINYTVNFNNQNINHKVWKIYRWFSCGNIELDFADFMEKLIHFKILILWPLNHTLY